MTACLCALAVQVPYRTAAGLEDADTASNAAAAFPEASAPVADIVDLALDELLGTVVSAAKQEQRVEAAPSTVDVIPFREIRARGYRTVGEALRHSPGLAVRDDHLYWSVGIRGVFGSSGCANEIIKVMINGQPISFRPTSVSFLEHDLVPVETIERIEIIRGPGSALYGANAFLGVINIITFTGGEDDRGPGHGAIGDAYYMENQQRGTLNGTASFFSGARFGKMRYFLGGTFNRANRSGLLVPGLEDIALDSASRNNPGIEADVRGYPSPGWDATARDYMLQRSASQRDLERAGSLYGIASHELGNHLNVQIDSHFQYADRHVEFHDFSFLTHKTRITHLNWFVRSMLTSAASTEPGLWFKLSAAVAGGRPTAKERIADRLVPRQSKRRQIGYRAFDGVLETRYTGENGSSVTVGLDTTVDREDLLSMELLSGSEGSTAHEEGYGKKTFTNLGGYAQLLWKVTPHLEVTWGTRADWNSQIACSADEWDCFFNRGDKTIEPSAPGEAAVLVTDRGVLQLSNRLAGVCGLPFWKARLKLTYGSSFKPPSPFQLYHRRLTISGSTRGNPTLKPQTADTLEAGLSVTPTQRLHVGLVFFLTRVADSVIHVKEGSNVDGRNADVTVDGVEIEVVYAPSSRVTVYGNLSYLFRNDVSPQRQQTETDYQWAESVFNTDVQGGLYPSFMCNAGIAVLAPEIWLSASVNVSYVAERYASLVNNQLYNRLDLHKTYSFRGHALADLSLSTLGWQPTGLGETVLSMSLRGVPGVYAEPGAGGIDVPALGPRLHVRAEQRW